MNRLGDRLPPPPFFLPFFFTPWLGRAARIRPPPFKQAKAAYPRPLFSFLSPPLEEWRSERGERMDGGPLKTENLNRPFIETASARSTEEKNEIYKSELRGLLFFSPFSLDVGLRKNRY